jgi:hypothetical protein
VTVVYPSRWLKATLAATASGPTVLTGGVPEVRLDMSDVVRLSGIVGVADGVTINANTELFTVHAKFWPSTSRHGAVRTAGNTSTHMRWTMSAAGVFTLSAAMTGAAGQGADCPLDDITYRK